MDLLTLITVIIINHVNHVNHLLHKVFRRIQWKLRRDSEIPVRPGPRPRPEKLCRSGQSMSDGDEMFDHLTILNVFKHVLTCLESVVV